MPSRRAGRSVSRKDTPLSPPKAAVHNSTAPQTRRSTRSASSDTDQSPAQSKPPVVQLQNIEEEENDPEERDDIEDGAAESISEVSSESSLDSAYELDALDREAIIDNLSDLYYDASKLLNTLTGAGSEILSQLHSDLPGASVLKKRAFANAKRFRVSREAYDSHRLYIKPSIIVKKLIEGQNQQEISYGLWRPDAILYLANLAQFLTDVTLGENDQIDASLSYMYNAFPDPLCASSRDLESSTIDRFTTAYSHETFALKLAIRTQAFISVYEKRTEIPEFDPDEFLMEIFLGEEESQDTELESSKLDVMVAEHITRIRQFFTVDSRNPVDLKGLHEHFGWSKFISQLAEWTALRQKELEIAIERQGGIASIVQLIQAGNFEAFHADAFDNKIEESISTPNPTSQGVPVANQAENQDSGKKRLSKPLSIAQLGKNIARLKDLKVVTAARLSGASTTPLVEVMTEQSIAAQKSPPREQTPQAITTTDAPILGDEYEHPALTQATIVPTQQTRVVLGVLKAQAEQSNKENIPKTKKSTTDGQESSVRTNSNKHEDQTKTQWPKRRRETEQTESDEDDFEEDTRAPKRSRIEQTRSSISKGKQPARNMRDELSNNDGEEEEQDEEEEDEEAEGGEQSQERQERKSLSTQPRQPENRSSAQPAGVPANPRSMLPPPSPTAPAPTSTQRPRPVPPRSVTPPSSLPASSQAAMVNAEAKYTVRTAKANNFDQRPQIRKAYTAEEVDRLIDLIASKGTRWAEMLVTDADRTVFPDGPRLQSRSQVQLKDKARNIKLDYLKARQILPAGFEYVSIGSKMVEMLRNVGISYVEGDTRGYYIT